MIARSSLGIVALWTATAITPPSAPAEEPAALLATIDALQQPIQDFQCECEGSLRFMRELASKPDQGDGEVVETFSGFFVRKYGGDTRSDIFRRRFGQIVRDSLVVRMKDQRVERYIRENNSPLGNSTITTPSKFNNMSAGYYGRIFLVDKMRRELGNTEEFTTSVRDDQLEGRPYKVLEVGLTGVPDSLIYRYLIDLRRTGQVVRYETYAPGKVRNGYTDIQLASFKIGDTEVWMPVFSKSVGYAAIKDKRPYVTKEPTSLETLYVVSGTMEFNKHPGDDVFTIQYKLGTPISDQLRKVTYEFGQPTTSNKPSKADAEKMLAEEVAKAEAQRKELVVASSYAGGDSWSWLAWGFGALALVSTVTLYVRSRLR